TFAQQPNDNGVKLGAKANPVAASASKVEKEPEPANFFLKLEAPGIAIIKKNDALTKGDSTTTSQTNQTSVAQGTASQEPQKQSPDPKWHYGGFVDVAYLLDFNHPANNIFRSRGTAWHVDNLYVNMAAAYLKKPASEESRWGVELTAQGGKDTEVFGFS